MITVESSWQLPLLVVPKLCTASPKALATLGRPPSLIRARIAGCRPVGNSDAPCCYRQDGLKLNQKIATTIQASDIRQRPRTDPVIVPHAPFPRGLPSRRQPSQVPRNPFAETRDENPRPGADSISSSLLARCPQAYCCYPGIVLVLCDKRARLSRLRSVKCAPSRGEGPGDLEANIRASLCRPIRLTEMSGNSFRKMLAPSKSERVGIA